MKRRTCSVVVMVTALAAGWPVPSQADVVARVISVVEGDRLTIRQGGRTNTISIKDIDCPELTQPYGKQAKRVTTAYVGNRDVVIRGLATDKQGRLSAEVLLQDGRSLGRELLKEGMAWWKRSASADQRLELLEELARAGGKGLWSDPKPVPPWEWKQQAKAKR
ncbi:MAG: thermonuclease family protein [Nitrospira sp.]|nr:thermonuclease family protein [Nitrospira sp.]